MKFPLRSKIILGSAVTLITITALSSCSKDNNPFTPPGINQKNAKFTMSVKDLNLAENDAVDLTINGADAAGTRTLWKVNGVTRQNEPLVSFEAADFVSGNDIVIESVTPVASVSVSISVFNTGAPVKLNYTPVVEGSSQTPVSVTVNDDYTKIFSY